MGPYVTHSLSCRNAVNSQFLFKFSMSRRREEEMEKRKKLRELMMKDREQKIKVLEAELERAKMEKSQKEDETLLQLNTNKSDEVTEEENRESLLGVSNEGRRPSRFSVSTVTDKKETNLSPTRPTSIKGILKKNDVHATINGTPFKHQLSPTQSTSSLSAADRWRYFTD